MSDVFSAAAKVEGAGETVSPAALSDLVGEGKKFATVEDLAKGKLESDRFIAQLQEELKGLRDASQRDHNAATNLAALQNEIASLKAKTNSPPEPSPNTKGELTQGQLEELVANAITKKEQERTVAQNIAMAQSQLVKAYGSTEKAQEMLSVKAAEIGMSVPDLRAIAAKSPTAFLQIIGATTKTASDGPDFGTQKLNPAALPLTNGQPKQGSAAYYNKMRKEIGNKAFFSNVKLQQEIFAAKKSGLYDSQ